MGIPEFQNSTGTLSEILVEDHKGHESLLS